MRPNELWRKIMVIKIVQNLNQIPSWRSQQNQNNEMRDESLKNNNKKKNYKKNI